MPDIPTTDSQMERLELLSELEQHLGAEVIVLYENASESPSPILESDAGRIEQILSRMSPVHPVCLLLHSSGGDVSAGIRIANALQSRDVTVIVPERAMSTACLIALSGAQLYVTRNTAFGAVDPWTSVAFGNIKIPLYDLKRIIKGPDKARVEEMIHDVKDCFMKSSSRLCPDKAARKVLIEYLVHKEGPFQQHYTEITPGQLAWRRVHLTNIDDERVELVHERYTRPNEFDSAVRTIIECSPSALVPRRKAENLVSLLSRTFTALSEVSPEVDEELASDVTEAIQP